MKKIFLRFLIFAITTITVCCQASGNNSEFNLDFETVTDPNGLPDGWVRWGMPPYDIKLDSVVKRSGKYSLRVDAKEGATAQDFGGLGRFIPAIYEGKKITVKAYMRTEGVENPIGLLLRINGDDADILQFDNMQQRGVLGTEAWEEYTVTLPLSKPGSGRDAKMIYIGAILSEKGKLWIDDIQLLIDGKDISKAKLKKRYKAEEDTEFSSQSNISIDSYTPQMLYNLEILCRVWGFLKYHHPAIAAGNYNWDAELFRIMPEILNATNKDDLNRMLLQWVDKLGKVSVKKHNEKRGIKLQPDLKWINEETLGVELTAKLRNIKDAKRSDNNYYVEMFHPLLPSPLFKNEKAYSRMNFDNDAGFRLLALFRYWNMIQYFYPYRYATDKDWNVVLGEFIPKFLDAKNEKEYKLTVLQLIAQVCDSHTAVFYDRTIAEIKGINRVPYNIRFIEGKALVTENLNADTTLRKGDIIVKIDGQPIEEIIAKKLPYTPASNYPTQLSRIAIELLQTNSENFTLDVIRGDKALTCVVNCIPLGNLYQNSSQKETVPVLPPDIIYVPGNIPRDSLPRIKERISDSKGMIMDFRHGQGGSISPITSIINYLTPKKMEFAKLTGGSITSPGQFAYIPAFQYAFVKIKWIAGKRNKEYYKGRVVVIVDENTISAGEFTTMAFQIAPQVIVIGSTTAAADGNVSGTIVLPGGINTQVTGIGVYYPDGRETQRVGIAIDEEVKPTIQGIIEGRDELLERAIKIIYDW